jgi:hypothetical protein
MVLETDPIVFSQWIGGAILFYLIAAGLITFGVLLVSFVVAAFRMGPLPAGDMLFKGIIRGFRDLSLTSPRRLLALAWLAMQESLRRRVLVVLGVFFVIMLFAGWFLDPTTNDPATLYLSFVLTTATYLVLLISLFLSVFSLPTDIKNRTITTIVTKPVRHGEIVLGRILGFSAVGTFMLAAMALVSYVFVNRALNHTHEVDLTKVVAVDPQNAPQFKSVRSGTTNGHRHEVTIDETSGKGETDVQQGHKHEVTIQQRGGKQVAVLGPPRGMLTARVPIYGPVRFKDRAGQTVAKGVNVGNEWGYRSFIEGGTLASAIWKFDNITPERFPKGLPLEMTLRVFRTYKGTIEKGINCSLVVKNPRTGKASSLRVFQAKDFQIDDYTVPVELKDAEGNPLNLFKDLVDNGQVEIWLQCLEPAQYLGVAKADLYLKARNASYTANFVKGYVGIWLQMILVISFGVMFSTFLSGPVAMMATISALLLGFFTQNVFDLAAHKVQGGGPVESLIRIVNQSNMTVEMDEGLTRDVVKAVDMVLLKIMEVFARLVPDFSTFSNVDYLAHGYNIPGDLVLSQIVSTLGYIAAVFIAGYFLLRTREVSK